MNILPIIKNSRKSVDINVGMALQGKVQCYIIDSKTKKVIKEFPEQKNLILNQGMDNMATQYICDLFSYAVAGSATTPTQDDSGVTTASRTGTTVTLVGGSFVFTNTATDAGKMIKFDTAEEVRILTVTSPTVVEVATSGTIASAEFTVYRTNQTGLATELKRTNTYLSGAGNSDTTINAGAGTIAFRRTYDFTAEVGSVGYNELGFSHSATVSNNLFSRILLASTVNLVVSQQLRVVYTLTVAFTPFTSTVVAVSPITNWATATGDIQVQYPNMAYIEPSTGQTEKVTGFVYGAKAFEPSQVGAGVLATLCTNTTAFNSFGSQGPDRSSGAVASANSTSSSYTSLTFTITKTCVFNTATANLTTWRTIVFGGITSLVNGFTRQGLVFLMANNQTKDNVHTLTLNMILTWGRTLA